MDQTLGAYSMLACELAMEDAGVTPDQIDGVICCDSHIAGSSGGTASNWAPRPYFEPPYDSEWGLTLVNGDWLVKQLALPNVKYAPSNVPTIRVLLVLTPQSIADGKGTPCLVNYSTRYIEGRFHCGGDNTYIYSDGSRQLTFSLVIL